MVSYSFFLQIVSAIDILATAQRATKGRGTNSRRASERHIHFVAALTHLDRNPVAAAHVQGQQTPLARPPLLLTLLLLLLLLLPTATAAATATASATAAATWTALTRAESPPRRRTTATSSQWRVLWQRCHAALRWRWSPRLQHSRRRHTSQSTTQHSRRRHTSQSTTQPHHSNPNPNIAHKQRAHRAQHTHPYNRHTTTQPYRQTQQTRC